MTVEIGTMLYGFCGGMFGRESYGTKIVEGIGRDWCVARELDTGEAQFYWHLGDGDAVDALAEYADLEV